MRTHRRFEDFTTSEVGEIFINLINRQYYLLSGSGVSLDSINIDNITMWSAGYLRDIICKEVGISNSRSLQQAYRLLTDKQKELFITNKYTCLTPGNSQLKICNIPWRRVYTLNVDNCTETAISLVCGEEVYNENRIEIKNYCDDFTDIKQHFAQSIIHLHGFVRRQTDGYIFGAREYADNLARLNPWMLTLTQLIRSEPFIIAGTSLEEVDFEYYISYRKNVSSVLASIPSILIEPFPDAVTEQTCIDNNLVLFRGTFEEFFNAIIPQNKELPYYWLLKASPLLENIPALAIDKASFEISFTPVPKGISGSKFQLSQFLLGGDLTWELVAANAIVFREVTSQVKSAVYQLFGKNEEKLLLLFDEPGSGKTAFMKTIAYETARTERTVLYFSGAEHCNPETAAGILGNLNGRVFVFCDNFADHCNYFSSVIALLKKSDIVFIGAERNYRLHYVEEILSSLEFDVIKESLSLSRDEAVNLVKLHERQGITAYGVRSNTELHRFASRIEKDVISVACCRIQNNYRAFDLIVKELYDAASNDQKRLFIVVGIARYCFGEGVGRQIAHSAAGHGQYSIDDANTSLKVSSNSITKGNLIPARTAIFERLLLQLTSNDRESLLISMISLAKALAPYVNRMEISKRSNNSKLSGSLMDYDRSVKKILGLDALEFYDRVKEEWDWNSRYWEQRALLKLDYFLRNPENKSVLDEAIQNARFAYAIERHPLSLTTLAKMLFAAMSHGNLREMFEEGWKYANESIEIEAGWRRMKGIVFVVLFKGVIRYSTFGGILDGDKTERLRDLISVTHRYKFHDKALISARDEVSAIISKN